MRLSGTARVRFDILAVMLVLGTLVPVAWAQTESPPTPWLGESNAELILILLSIVVLVLVGGTKAIDLKRKREDDAVRLQAQMSDALLHDRRLSSLPVAATVHIPVWKGAPPRIEMSGQVPTAELWQAVRQVAKQEASRTLDAFHMDDRIAVVPSVRARAARGIWLARKTSPWIGSSLPGRRSTRETRPAPAVARLCRGDFSDLPGMPILLFANREEDFP